ncbi:MAG: hypothetical protein WD708_02575 [Kiritimatiellia bacterium]
MKFWRVANRKSPGWMAGIVVAAMLGYGGVKELVYLRETRAMLRDWGLPVSVEHWRLIRPVFRDREIPAMPRGPTVEMFAPGVPYTSLTGDGGIRLGVYVESRDRWDVWANRVHTLQSRAEDSGVDLVVLRDLESLRDAMRQFDVVIFSGHSNLGQGLYVWSGEREEDVLLRVEGAAVVPDIPERHRMTEDQFPIVDFPELKAPVFLHLGCRSAVYYSKALHSSFTDTGFLFTHYEWGPGDHMVFMLDLLCEGLEHRRPLSDVLERWEQFFLMQQIQGRGREHRKYPSDSPFAEGLFRWQTPSGASPN